VILHDRTLHELAARRPQTIGELLDVPGIGEAKAARYGAALVELLSSSEGA
jgi:ATP-dependent DNA helicase RecQ